MVMRTEVSIQETLTWAAVGKGVILYESNDHCGVRAVQQSNVCPSVLLTQQGTLVLSTLTVDLPLYEWRLYLFILALLKVTATTKSKFTDRAGDQ